LTAIIVILLAILGASLGSFFNVLIHRLPLNKSIIKPLSSCASCEYKIPFYLNIPIISYIILKGKCKNCGANIHWHHLVVEILTPAILIAVFYKFGIRYGITHVLFLKYAILCLVLIPIFFTDAFHHIIPHVLSIPLIPIGLLFSLHPYSDLGIVSAAITGGAVFAFLYIIALLYMLIRKQAGLGGGDIWLLTGIATFLGPLNMPFIFILSALLGILWFVIFIRNKELEFAFGTFIAVSTIIWVFAGDMIITFLWL
jgi:leader peptidase (prepilin peptidase)/N-methyltransferase